MANKRKPIKKRDPNRLYVIKEPSEDDALAMARTALRPKLQAAVTLKEYNRNFEDLDLTELTNCLVEQTKVATGGDLKQGEAMLTAQAHTLDAIFNNLARRAALNMGEYMQACEVYLKLALRAQSQCRATWEALATIKNPPVMGYVGQANVAHGPQQVNNASSVASEAPRTRENPNLKNKLLEDKDGERLDPGAACTPGRADPEMATVEEVDGTKDRGR